MLQARSDDGNDSSLDSCLTVRQLQPDKPSTKLTKTKKPTIKMEDTSAAAPILSIPYVGQITMDSTCASTSDNTDMTSSGYYSAFSSTSHLPTTTAEEASPSNILHSQAVLPLQHGYQHLTQPSSRMWLGNTCPSSGSSLFTASPMETMMYSSNTGYQGDCSADIGLLMHPSHPPPNYSEATSLGQHQVYQGQFIHPMPPHYDSIVVGNEYPPHLPAALPNNTSSIT